MSSIFTYDNLLLAWKRISTGRNIPYKRFYRSIYIAYEIACEKNIRNLYTRLKGSWQPSKPERIYLPKPSGLQRPITLLSLEDQIVLQCIANFFAEKLSKRRKRVEHKVVFSNIIGNPRDTLFFIDDWRLTYREFQNKCETYFRNGNVWIAHFDLAAYYDTICHQRLIRLVAPSSSEREPWSTIKEWLRFWTTAHDPDGSGHGIPQGPIAANFLAECMLLPLDEKMLDEKVGYVRYVDDIRIFAKTEIEAQKAAVQLEVYCRSRGLIPQGKKYAIKRAENIKDALGTLPSINPQDISPEKDDPTITVKNAEKLFTQSIGGRPLKIEEKSRARYILFRSPRSNRILSYVTKLLSRHPEHIDAFVCFLTNYTKSPSVEAAIMKIIQAETPYGYVRGELYHIIARIGSESTLKLLSEYAKRDLRNNESCVVLRWGAMALLLACERKGICKAANRIKYQPPLVQAFLTPIIPLTELRTGGAFVKMLTSEAIEPAISAITPLLSNRNAIKSIGLQIKTINPVAQNTLKELGLIGRRFSRKVDQISDILTRLFQTSSTMEWHGLLGVGYMHALSILIQAERIYHASPSAWLQLQNSFNDAALRAFLIFLFAKNLPGGRSISNKNGQLIEIGILLDINCPFSNTYPTIADCFRTMNERRNKVPGSHPYDKKTGQQTTFLKAQERNRFAANLRIVYDTIISIYVTNK